MKRALLSVGLVLAVLLSVAYAVDEQDALTAQANMLAAKGLADVAKDSLNPYNQYCDTYQDIVQHITDGDAFYSEGELYEGLGDRALEVENWGLAKDWFGKGLFEYLQAAAEYDKAQTDINACEGHVECPHWGI